MKKAIPWRKGLALGTCGLMFAVTAAGGFAALPSKAAPYKSTVTTYVDRPMQTFDGWGLSLSWWATMIGDWTRVGSTGKEKREEIMEALYGKSGLDLNIARYNVGGGDNPSHTHMTRDRNTPGWRTAEKVPVTYPDGTESETDTTYEIDPYYAFGDANASEDTWLAWDQPGVIPDYNQLWVLDWIQKNYEARENGESEDYITEYYSNSPPYWLTKTDCSSGGEGGWDNLDPLFNEDFVDYFLDVYEYLVSQGFKLDVLQPFNESGSTFWKVNGDQEGCYFSPAQKVQILGILREKLQERGLEVPYNWGDETNTNVAYQQYSQAVGLGATQANIVRGAERYTFHTYSYDDSGLERLNQIAQTDRKQLWMSEICWTEGDEYDPEATPTGFKYTDDIVRCLNHGGVNAFVFWQGVEDMVGQMKSGTNYGLIQGVYYDQEEAEAQGADLASMGYVYQDYVLSKAYYMSGQFTKYIRPGYSILEISDKNDAVAAISPDGKTLVIVKENDGDGKAFGYKAEGFRPESIEKIVTDEDSNWEKSYLSVNPDGSFSDAVTPHSVTTYVIHGQSLKGGGGRFIDDYGFIKENSLQAINNEIAENPEIEAVYSMGFKDGSTDSESVYYGHNAYTDNGTIAVRFYGTGIAAVTMKKKDAAKLQVWIDPEDTTLAGACTYEESLYADTASKGNIVVRKNDLEKGWHTAYIKPTTATPGGSWVNLDGIFIYKGTKDVAQAEGQNLAVTAATGVGSQVKLTYTATGYDGYSIYTEYFEGGDWHRSAEAVTDGSATIATDGVNGTARVRIVAVKDGEDDVYSNVYAVNLLKQKNGVLYFVDCGTSDWYSLAEGALLGTAQSMSDKHGYDADPFTGVRWGLEGEFPGNIYYGDSDAASSVLSLDVDGHKDDTLTYKFTIPQAGNYKVTVVSNGGGDGWGTRTMNVNINGTGNEDLQVTEFHCNAVTKEVTTNSENQEITVAVSKKSGGDAMFSAIVITKTDTKLPLYAEDGSNYNSLTLEADTTETIKVGEVIDDKVKEGTLNVRLTDGTTASVNAADCKRTVTLIGEDEDADKVVHGSEIIVTFESETYPGLLIEKHYNWNIKDGEELYYNIDCGFVGSGTPPDDTAGLIGSKQSTTHDRVYGADSSKSTNWGYTESKTGGVSWENDKSNEWSMRSGTKSSHELEYKMNGFKANEQLRISYGGHLANDGSWGGRSYAVYVNGDTEKSASEIELPNNDSRASMTFQTNAAADGTLTLLFKSTKGDEPWVTYIKVWSVDQRAHLDPVSCAEGTAVTERDTELTLGNISEGATVYIYDENGTLLHSEKPSSETITGKFGEKLAEDSHELHIVQVYTTDDEKSEDFRLVSDELVIDFPTAVATFDGITQIPNGEYTTVLFTPKTYNAVTSLTLITPSGVQVDLIAAGFYFRARENGTYKLRVMSGGVESETTFTIDNVDYVENFFATYDRAWTNGDVTVTFKPVAAKGIASFKVGKAGVGEGTLEEIVAAEGVYTFTAAENGEYVAYLQTSAGFAPYEYAFTIDNIDSAAANVELTFDHMAGSAVTLNYSSENVSGGKLYVKKDGGDETEMGDLNAISLDLPGKYEIRFVTGSGNSSATYTYYVTDKPESATLATVSLGKDGTVTVGKKDAEIKATLYHAGEEEALSELKATAAGKYYLEIESGGAHEIVSFSIEPQSAKIGTEGGSSSNGNTGIMIAGIVIGCAALAAAAVVCTLLVLKGRKTL